MPASGKSTVGVILAKVIGYDFIDSDLLIQRREGMRLSEIIAEKGGFVRAYFGGTKDDETRIREETGATPRCILPGDNKGKCIITGNDGARLTVFAKAY